MTGHLFVIHGDLRTLACDAVVIPCDDAGHVNPTWRPLLPSERLSDGPHGWLHVEGLSNARHHRLPDRDNRAVHLVDTVGDVCSVEELVDRTVRAVSTAATEIASQEGRVQPLIGLPLVGTGAGGLAHRRGAVVTYLVDRLIAHAQRASHDVVIVANDARDLAALQQVRPEHAWLELDPGLREAADSLGQRAARGELSLFVGAGVSIPVGLPSWSQLLTELAAEAGADVPETDGRTYLEVAEDLRRDMGDRHWFDFLERRFTVERYGLSHGLVAGLGLKRLVTTNYDCCIELAMTPVLGSEGFRVMTRSLAGGGRPWLLKLHGDVTKPETLVLTSSDYAHVREARAALYGTVQGLMLTSHLLFVGFSLVDEAFLELAGAVQRVRREADDLTEAGRTAGTALTLHEGAVESGRWDKDLTVLPVSEATDVGTAARRLEIFLDRLAWSAARSHDLAAQYLLDRRYDEGFTSDGDVALRTALLELLERLPEEARTSSGWPAFSQSLTKLGADLTASLGSVSPR